MTKRNLTIVGIVILFIGFAITVIANRVLHVTSTTPGYVGAGFGAVGAIIYLIAKTRP